MTWNKRLEKSLLMRILASQVQRGEEVGLPELFVLQWWSDCFQLWKVNKQTNNQSLLFTFDPHHSDPFWTRWVKPVHTLWWWRSKILHLVKKNSSEAQKCAQKICWKVFLMLLTERYRGYSQDSGRDGGSPKVYWMSTCDVRCLWRGKWTKNLLRHHSKHTHTHSLSSAGGETVSTGPLHRQWTHHVELTVILQLQLSSLKLARLTQHINGNVNFQLRARRRKTTEIAALWLFVWQQQQRWK